MFRQGIKIVWRLRRQNALLLLELFVSFILLAGAFAYLLHNYQLFKTPLGFSTKDRLLVLFEYTSDVMDKEEYTGKLKALELELSNRPEVESYSFGNVVYPFSWNSWTSSSEENNVVIRYSVASMDDKFQQAMGLELSQGRWLSKPLDSTSLEEIVVNQQFLDQYFGSAPMLDSVVNLQGDKKIVGIMQHYKYNGEFEEEDPIVISYQDPYAQEEANCLYVKIKENTPVVFEEQLSQLVYETTGIKEFIIRNLEADRVAASKPTWINLLAITALAVFLVVNVAMGLFGVLWVNISKRKIEISLRKAVGATIGRIVLQLCAEVLLLACIALLGGVLIFWQITAYELIDWLDASIMYNAMWYAVIFVVVLVLLCSAYPAWRAAQMQPVTGLQED